jgi:hypothetical protein
MYSALLAVMLGTVTELAVIVTTYPFGETAGAVYVTVTPLALDAGMNPQSADLQLNDQETPALALSPVTVALSGSVPPGARFVGRAETDTLIL